MKVEDLKNMPFQRLKSKVNQISGEYDYVILDSAPGFGKEALITLDAADEVLMVTNPLAHTVTDLLRANELAKRMKTKNLGVAANMVRKKGYELNKSEIEGIVGVPVHAMIPFDNKVMESINRKHPVIHMNSRTNSEFRRLAAVISGEAVENKAGMFSFFSRMFGK